jgi:hypothetical protein
MSPSPSSSAGESGSDHNRSSAMVKASTQGAVSRDGSPHPSPPAHMSTCVCVCVCVRVCGGGGGGAGME